MFGFGQPVGLAAGVVPRLHLPPRRQQLLDARGVAAGQVAHKGERLSVGIR